MRYLLLLPLLLTACSHKPASIDAPKPSETPSMILPQIKRMELAAGGALGKSGINQKLSIGGFSGLRFLGKAGDGRLRFLTLTDRGPNAAEQLEGDQIIRPFTMPEFQPQIVYLLADPARGTLEVEKTIPLRRPDGKPLSGLPARAGGEVPVDIKGQPLAYDPYGMDPEGIALNEDGSFWIGEEYGPSLAHFSSEGQLQQVLRPGQGLPKVFAQIRINRGFEGVTLGNGRLYGMLQSPLDNPRSPGQENSAKSHLVRIVEIDPVERKTLAQYAYLLGPGKADKIGDIAFSSSGEFFAIEQNGKVGEKSVKKIFRFRLDKASNLQLMAEKLAGPGGSLETTKKKDLAAAGVVVAEKQEVCDLAALGVKESKAEGIDFVDDKTLAVIVDNDFGLEGEWDKAAGKVSLKDEKPTLYLIDISR